MREIKCRAKTEFSTTELDKLGIKHENGWIYGTYLDGYIVNEVVEATNEYISLGDWFPVLENTVGQFTGLKDKNGKEIYEGDILELINEYSERVKAICKFGNRRLMTVYGATIDIQCFYFQIGERKTNLVVNNYKGLHDLEIIEVIGNIYENPELLEGLNGYKQ